MSKLESIQNQCIKTEKDAMSFLKSISILDYDGYRNSIIDIKKRLLETAVSPIHNYDFGSNHDLCEFNQESFTFKFIDKSIIYYYISFDSKGNINKSGFTYISGHYSEDDYNAMTDSISDEEQDKLDEIFSNLDDLDKEKYQDSIIDICLSKRNINNNIIDSIKKINRNPIVIRIDRDVANAECNHPENHLTINNIKNSRFRVENIINIFDFVVFVLDILYGVKAQDSKQFISLNYIV